MRTFRQAGTALEELSGWLAGWIVNNPIRSMIGSVLLVLLAAIGMGGYHYSLDHRVFFSHDNPQLQAYEKLHADYSRTDAILLVLAPQSGNVFNREFLGILNELTEKAHLGFAWVAG